MKDVPYILENVDLDSLEADQRERIAKIFTSNVTLEQLIARFDASQNKDRIINDDYYDIQIVLRDKFSVVSIQDANKSIKAICEKLEQLESKFRNHRHETGRTYSAKPEY